MKKIPAKKKGYDKSEGRMLNLDEFFSQRPGQRKVAEFLLKNAVRVGENSKLFVKGMEIPYSSVSEILGVDRRVIKSTAEFICSCKELREIYSKLDSALLLRDVAPLLGFGAIELIPTHAARSGIVAGVTRIIDKSGISIRQIISDDPMFPEAETTVITEKPLPRNLIDKMLLIPGVKKIIVIS